jgi:hypothetical protein
MDDASVNSDPDDTQVWLNPNNGDTSMEVNHTTPYPHPGPTALLPGEIHMDDLVTFLDGEPAPVVPVSTDCTNLQKIINLMKDKDCRIPALLVHSWQQQALWALEYIGNVELSDTKEYNPNDLFEYIHNTTPKLLASWQGPYTT